MRVYQIFVDVTSRYFGYMDDATETHPGPCYATRKAAEMAVDHFYKRYKDSKYTEYFCRIVEREVLDTFDAERFDELTDF